MKACALLYLVTYNHAVGYPQYALVVTLRTCYCALKIVVLLLLPYDIVFLSDEMLWKK